MINNSSKKRQYGFTIVEVISVVVVIGILAGIVVVSYSGTRNRATKSSYNATAQQVKLKLGDYFTDNNKYPSTKGTSAATADSVLKYLTDVGGSSTTLATDFAGSAYVYTPTPQTPTACNNTSIPCTGYTITVAKSNWGNGAVASDSDIVVAP